jgi:hypothetical protein
VNARRGAWRGLDPEVGVGLALVEQAEAMTRMSARYLAAVLAGRAPGQEAGGAVAVRRTR